MLQVLDNIDVVVSIYRLSIRRISIRRPFWKFPAPIPRPPASVQVLIADDLLLMAQHR
jgi:hypothetical protein